MKRKAKKGMHPGVAAGIFLVAASFAGMQVMSVMRGPAKAGASGGGALFTPGASGSDSSNSAIWVDLLAKYGSYEPGTEVALVFGRPKEAPRAAPIVESKPDPDAWIGSEPPQLTLGVVMVSDDASRVVIDGAVLGVDDHVRGARIIGIQRGLVTVEWEGKHLSYDLEDAWPREYRTSMARMAAKRRAAELEGQEQGNGVGRSGNGRARKGDLR